MITSTYARLLFGGLSIVGYRPNMDEATFVETTEGFSTIDQVVWMAERFSVSEHVSPTLRRMGTRELLLHCRRLNIKLKVDGDDSELRIDCLESASSSKHCASITLRIHKNRAVTGVDKLVEFANDTSRGNLHFELIELRNWLAAFGIIIPEPTPVPTPEENAVGQLVTALA
jgi:hypothetical protein